MTKLDNAVVEAKIIKAVDEIKNKLKIDAVVVNIEFCPGKFISSQILVTLMGRIADSLEVNIPENCYIFHDKKTLKQLTIKEAAQKLIKEAQNEK
ncbi:hypothetical protein OCK74_11900 [Chitinophagaceae bacterium LB-8]|uniref:Uncharacterized protein n=1 Tax=Paraflavisolibacter caeni TaxID=2982496 RepID=A0A9X2XP37_9BACT|nr:hypothetical protein [Paraflavisolibacter caeni]MCU7549824.1 hypothetical protein [Paraflavisolibacter caeni]